MDIVAGCSPAPMRVGGRGRPCVGVRRGEPQGRASAHAACREPACAARGVSTAKADAKSAACRHGGRRRLRHAGAQTSQWSSWPRVASRATAILRLGGSREAAAVHRWGQQAEAADHKSIAQERRATMHKLTCSGSRLSSDVPRFRGASGPSRRSSTPAPPTPCSTAPDAGRDRSSAAGARRAAVALIAGDASDARCTRSCCRRPCACPSSGGRCRRT